MPPQIQPVVDQPVIDLLQLILQEIKVTNLMLASLNGAIPEDPDKLRSSFDGTIIG